MYITYCRSEDRVFTRFFNNKDQVNAYIKKDILEEGEIDATRYRFLTGEQAQTVLKDLEYFPPWTVIIIEGQFIQPQVKEIIKKLEI